MGPEFTCPPSDAFHNNSPVRAFSAKKYPSRPPLNSRSDAVVSTPAQVVSPILYSHLRSPFLGSKARKTPYPSSSVRTFGSSFKSAMGDVKLLPNVRTDDDRS